MAKLNLDGAEKELRAVSPAEFPLEVCVLSGTIKKTSGNGELGFVILEGTSQLGFAKSIQTPGSSVRFRYHDNGVEVWF